MRLECSTVHLHRPVRGSSAESLPVDGSRLQMLRTHISWPGAPEKVFPHKVWALWRVGPGGFFFTALAGKFQPVCIFGFLFAGFQGPDRLGYLFTGFGYLMDTPHGYPVDPGSPASTCSKPVG